LRRAGAPSGFQSRLLGRRIPYGWWVIGALFLMQCVANGVVFLSFGLFVTPLVGRVFDVTGSYNSAFYALTGGFAVAILLLFTLKPLPKGKG
jgi:hypothetical protein